MQATKTATAIPSAYRKNIHQRAHLNHPFGHSTKRSTASASRPAPRNGFLKTVIQSIPASRAGCGLIFQPHEIQNLRSNTPAYIIATANNYLKLRGINKCLKSTGNLDEDCVSVYSTLAEILPDVQDLSFEFYKSQYSICITHSFWGDFTNGEVFFLPIGGIEKMSPPIADLFKQFISYYAKSQEIYFPAEQSYFSPVINDVSMLDEDNEYESEIELYTNGIAGQTFKQIQELQVNPDALKIAIYTCIDSSQSDRELLNLMIEGVNLLRTDSICNYSRQYDTDDYYCDFSSLFAIVWAADFLVESATHAAKSDMWESEFFPIPTYFQSLTPTDKELPKKKKTYPVDFSNWYSKFNNKLSDYA